MTIFKEIKEGFNNFIFNRFGQEWTPNTLYKKGCRIKYFGIILECIESHNSGSTFDSKYWKNPFAKRVIR